MKLTSVVPLRRPTMDGKVARGVESFAKPAFTILKMLGRLQRSTPVVAQLEAYGHMAKGFTYPVPLSNTMVFRRLVSTSISTVSTISIATNTT